MKKLLTIILLSSVIILSSCSKDDPDPVLPQEVITSLTYTLTSTSGAVFNFKFEDPDGDGGIEPTVTADDIPANTTFTGRIELLNQTLDPIEDVTLEVLEEDLDHQFFYSSTLNGVSISYQDQDSAGNPLGVDTEVTTGAAGNGQLTVILRHEPVKDAEGVSTGDITNAGGETDIEVTFNLNVQ